VCCTALSQGLLESLNGGVFRGDSTNLVDKLVNSSLAQLGADKADAAVYESMLLDVATVLYGRNPRAAVCAWQTVHESAAYKFRKLLDCSLVKIVSEVADSETVWSRKGVTHKLWVHDVIKSIASRNAHTEIQQCMTRVWLPDQLNTAMHLCTRPNMHVYTDTLY
jgi:hypothetical protein